MKEKGRTAESVEAECARVKPKLKREIWGWEEQQRLKRRYTWGRKIFLLVVDLWSKSCSVRYQSNWTFVPSQNKDTKLTHGSLSCKWKEKTKRLPVSFKGTLVISRRAIVVTDTDAKLWGFYFNFSEQDLCNGTGVAKFRGWPGREVVSD